MRTLRTFAAALILVTAGACSGAPTAAREAPGTASFEGSYGSGNSEEGGSYGSGNRAGTTTTDGDTTTARGGGSYGSGN